MIRTAHSGEYHFLTDIAFASKRYWGYPERYFDVWCKELTINAEYIECNRVFVYEEDETPQAFYSLVHLADGYAGGRIRLCAGWWLDHMFVHPRSIGRGIGRSLFRHMEKYCLQHGIRQVHILADPHAQTFYEKMDCVYITEKESSIEGRTTPYLIRHIPKQIS
ncbi:MAG: GNAT family N-acetyltransferase [Spirochaetota bacterium]